MGWDGMAGEVDSGRLENDHSWSGIVIETGLWRMDGWLGRRRGEKCKMDDRVLVRKGADWWRSIRNSSFVLGLDDC